MGDQRKNDPYVSPTSRSWRGSRRRNLTTIWGVLSGASYLFALAVGAVIGFNVVPDNINRTGSALVFTIWYGFSMASTLMGHLVVGIAVYKTCSTIRKRPWKVFLCVAACTTAIGGLCLMGQPPHLALWRSPLGLLLMGGTFASTFSFLCLGCYIGGLLDKPRRASQ